MDINAQKLKIYLEESVLPEFSFSMDVHDPKNTPLIIAKAHEYCGAETTMERKLVSKTVMSLIKK